jgi:hypothetical protein
MKNAKSTKTGHAASGSSRAATAPSSTTASSSPCGCGCHEQALEPCGCCKLTCFERPKYFCGQLLSDADLTLEETYFREKNKLYHRMLDGFGVVCGLRLRCDPDCCGHITIGEGYAIDCCGNDLVVCEPRSYDLICELRKKKWLVEIPREHRHKHKHDHDAYDDHRDYDNRHDYDDGPEREDDDDCIHKQCFYIGICYAEEPADYATPYTTECNPAPGPCQPTRIRECVRFEVYDKLPVRPNPLEEIGKRIECSFRIFREGQFSRGLRSITPRIQEILCNQDQANREEGDAHHLFRELRAQFLHELRACPDQYNCDLEHEVHRLRPPRGPNDDSGPTAAEAFTRLLELIQRHVFSCVLAELAFPCPEPAPCCVLIGSVEVVNGHLTRVINYPRWYLWCFANFFEVLIYQLANDAACGRRDRFTRGTVEEPRKRDRDGCCPGFEVDVCEFLGLFHAENRAFEKAARTSVDAMLAIYRALVEAFDFMRPHGLAGGVLEQLPVETASALAKLFGIKFEKLQGEHAGPSDIFGAVANHMMNFGSESFVYEEGANRVTRVNRVAGSSAFAVGQFTAQSIEERLAWCETQLNAMTAKPEQHGTPPPETPHEGEPK